MSESTSTRYHFNDTARRTTLASSVAQGDGTVEVNTATNLPSTPFLVAVWAEQGSGNFKYHEADMEMMEVTGVNGTTFTVTRGVAGTSAMSFTAGDLVETSVQTAQVMDHKLPTVSAAEYTDDTSDGGAAIQAAIDDLPSRGGIVHIPVMGPDDGVTDHDGNTLNNVWEVTSGITDGGKKSVLLVGSGAGTLSASSGGTKLIGTSIMSSVVSLGSDGISGCKGLYIDSGNDGGGGAEAGRCVNLGQGGAVEGFILQSCILVGGTGEIARVSCNGEVWVDNCWFIDNLGESRGIASDIGRNFWVNDCVFDLAGTSLSHSGIELISSITSLYIDACKFIDVGGAGVYLSSNIDDSKISDIVCEGADTAFILVPSGTTVTRLSVEDCSVVAGGTTDHAVDNQGTLVDSSFDNIKTSGLNQTEFNNVINDVTNTTRVTINGLGYNGANNPASAGDWNGNGKEGVRVLWTSNGDEVISEYRNGSWVIEDAVALIRLGYNVGAGGLPLDAVNRDTIGGVSTSRDTGNNEITISSNVGFQPGNAVPVVMPVQSGVAAYGRVRYSSGNIILGFADSSGTSIDIDADDWEVYVKVEYHG